MPVPAIPVGRLVEANFVRKGARKCQLAVQHRKIASQAEASRLRAFWTERLAKIGELLDRSR